MLCQGTMTKVLTKVAHWYPDLDFDTALESLPEDADIAALKERINPSSAASMESRGWRASAGIRHPVSHCRCRFMTKTISIFS